MTIVVSGDFISDSDHNIGGDYFFQVILSAIQIITSGEIIFFFFRKNDEVIDALETQKRIMERIRLNRMDHLAGNGPFHLFVLWPRFVYI